MPRYFYRMHDGVTYVDREGEEHPDDEAARRAAQKTANQLSSNIRDAEPWEWFSKGQGKRSRGFQNGLAKVASGASAT
jgi:hypothetical protein